MRINHRTQPIQGYHKAKELFWDPRKIDLNQDRADWQTLNAREQDIILRLFALFHAGEEAVTHDLAPLLMALRREGDHLEEEMFLITQLFEEVKHVEWFDRWMDEVVRDPIDLEAYHSDSYRQLFYEDLPQTLTRPLNDPSPKAQAEAGVVYHMIIEGVLAETGYYSFGKTLKARGLMPGMTAGIQKVQADEARHIAFGVYFLQRLVRVEPALMEVINRKMNDLLPKALDVISEALVPYGDDIPFGLDVADFVEYASRHFNDRLEAIERAIH